MGRININDRIFTIEQFYSTTAFDTFENRPPDVRSLDGFGWRCRAPINKQKNKCDYYQSIRVDTFFHKSHLSLYQIVSFAYLWLENVSLSFIGKQIKIAQHTAVDWSSFHREVVFEAMITNHNKIGKFKITYLRIKS